MIYFSLKIELKVVASGFAIALGIGYFRTAVLETGTRKQAVHDLFVGR